VSGSKKWEEAAKEEKTLFLDVEYAIQDENQYNIIDQRRCAS
jgi:hypothetical protein